MGKLTALVATAILGLLCAGGLHKRKKHSKRQAAERDYEERISVRSRSASRSRSRSRGRWTPEPRYVRTGRSTSSSVLRHPPGPHPQVEDVVAEESDQQWLDNLIMRGLMPPTAQCQNQIPRGERIEGALF